MCITWYFFIILDQVNSKLNSLADHEANVYFVSESTLLIHEC